MLDDDIDNDIDNPFDAELQAAIGREIDADNPLIPSGDVTRDRLDRAAELDARIIDATRLAYDPTDKLKRQCQLGEAFVERAKHQKLNTTDWSRKAYSNLASKQEETVKLVLGINGVRLDVSAKIYGFVEFVKVANPLVENVSYYRISNHFIRMFKWDCKALEGTIDAEWLTFIRTVIDRNAETENVKPMSIKELVSLIEAEKARRKLVEDSKPNDKAGKALEAAATRQKNAAIKRRDDAREGFIEAVGALRDDGQLNGSDLTKHFIASAESCGVKLIEPGQTPPIDGTALTLATVRELMQSMFSAGKVVEIAEMVKIGQQVIALAKHGMRDAA
jgi:hypothetical protein